MTRSLSYKEKSVQEVLEGGKELRMGENIEIREYE